MIPDIGLMIGAYIVLRCVEIMTKPASCFFNGNAAAVTKILSFFTMVATMILCLMLLAQGASLTSGAGQPMSPR